MDTVLQAISDESRRILLGQLRKGPATVNELAALLPIARPGVSRHLRVLREVGLVDVRNDAQRRIYSLRSTPLRELDTWLEPYRAEWQQRFEALHTEIARGKQRSIKRSSTGKPTGKSTGEPTNPPTNPTNDPRKEKQ